MKQQKDGNWFSRHKILTGILGFFLLVIVISAVSGGNNEDDAGKTATENNKTEKDAKKDETKLAKVGEVARDGKFEFTVSGVECGKPSVGENEYLQKQAQGQYCLLDLTIKNIGNESQMFDSSNTYLYDAANAKFSADGAAAMYANPQGSTFLNQINPGNSVTGKIPFDLPKDKTPVTAELHDSVFSGGVKVQLN